MNERDDEFETCRFCGASYYFEAGELCNCVPHYVTNIDEWYAWQCLDHDHIEFLDGDD